MMSKWLVYCLSMHAKVFVDWVDVQLRVATYRLTWLGVLERLDRLDISCV